MTDLAINTAQSKFFKSTLLGLRQFLAIVSPLRMMKSVLIHIKSSFPSQDI